MASSPEYSSSPLEDAQKDPSVDGPSQPASIGNVRVEDDKAEDGKKKKKKKRGNKRSAGAKKRGTGFEGKSQYPITTRRLWV